MISITDTFTILNPSSVHITFFTSWINNLYINVHIFPSLDLLFFFLAQPYVDKVVTASQFNLNWSVASIIWSSWISVTSRSYLSLHHLAHLKNVYPASFSIKNPRFLIFWTCLNRLGSIRNQLGTGKNESLVPCTSMEPYSGC